MSPVVAPGANNMMRSQKNFGSAESGRGVMLAGFYAPNGEVQDRLKAMDADQGPFSRIALHESDGWSFFLGASGPVVTHGVSRVGHFRRESHKFFDDLAMWLFQTKATGIRDMALSQSNGFLSITFLYGVDVPSV